MWALVIAFLQEQSKPSLIFNPGTILMWIKLFDSYVIATFTDSNAKNMSRKRIWN